MELLRPVSSPPTPRRRSGQALLVTASVALLVPVGLGLVAPRDAGATVALKLSIEQLAAESPIIVRGRVIRQVSRWSKNGAYIVTHSTVRVNGLLKGRIAGGASEIVVRQRGGTVNGVTMVLSGNATLSPQEEVVLFLKADASYHYVQALAQGKFSVYKSPAGIELLKRDLSGLSFAPSGRKLRPADLTQGGVETALKLTDLVNRIRVTAPQGGR